MRASVSASVKWGCCWLLAVAVGSPWAHKHNSWHHTKHRVNTQQMTVPFLLLPQEPCQIPLPRKVSLRSRQRDGDPARGTLSAAPSPALALLCGQEVAGAGGAAPPAAHLRAVGGPQRHESPLCLKPPPSRQRGDAPGVKAPRVQVLVGPSPAKQPQEVSSSGPLSSPEKGPCGPGWPWRTLTPLHASFLTGREGLGLCYLAPFCPRCWHEVWH